MLGYAQDVLSRVLRPAPRDRRLCAQNCTQEDTGNVFLICEFRAADGGVALGVPPRESNPREAKYGGILRLCRATRPFVECPCHEVGAYYPITPTGLTRGPLADRQCRARSRLRLGGRLDPRRDPWGFRGGVRDTQVRTRYFGVSPSQRRRGYVLADGGLGL